MIDDSKTTVQVLCGIAVEGPRPAVPDPEIIELLRDTRVASIGAAMTVMRVRGIAPRLTFRDRPAILVVDVESRWVP